MKQFILFASLLIGTLFSCSENTTDQPIVFMDNFKVFEEFEMKKDYDLRLEKELGAERSQLDAMATKLNGVKDPLELAAGKKELYVAQQTFDQKFEVVSEQYTNEVYKRLNTYIQSYGKKNNYRMIMGSNGQGSVMYVDTTANITVDLIKYINSEYAK